MGSSPKQRCVRTMQRLFAARLNATATLKFVMRVIWPRCIFMMARSRQYPPPAYRLACFAASAMSRHRFQRTKATDYCFTRTVYLKLETEMTLNMARTDYN